MLHCPETAAAARLLNELLLVLRTAVRAAPLRGQFPGTKVASSGEDEHVSASVLLPFALSSWLQGLPTLLI